MADPRPDYEQAPVPARPQDGTRRRLGLAVALTLVIAVVVVGAIQGVGLLTNVVGLASPGGSPETAASPESSAPLASPAGSARPIGTPEPSRFIVPPTSPGLVAVVDDNGRLSTMDDGGGSRVDYPVTGVTFGFPAWSPDGTQIAVVGDSANDETEIYVFTVPAGDATNHGSGPAPKPVVIYRSSTHPAFYLYWTPDGRSVAFLATEANEISLRIAPADGHAPLDGSGPGSLIRTGAPLYYDWIDNERLLVHVGTGSTAFTGEVGLDGKPLKATLPGTGNFRSPSRSPDGRYQAYVTSKTDVSGQLVVSARDGSTSHELPVFGPAAFIFNPTGDDLATIAALSAADPNLGVPIGPLRIVDPATGKARTLSDGSVVAFFWSPDGKTIAAMSLPTPGQQSTAGTGVVLAAVAPGPSAGDVAQAPGSAVWLEFIDVATGSARSGRIVNLADHFVGQLLPYFDQYALSHRLWSPDSASMLIPIVDATGRNQVAVVPADGSDPRPVADGAKGFWSP